MTRRAREDAFLAVLWTLLVVLVLALVVAIALR